MKYFFKKGWGWTKGGDSLLWHEIFSKKIKIFTMVSSFFEFLKLKNNDSDKTKIKRTTPMACLFGV